tara:strand:+ start:4342 stop:5340 length:999 start_codon:yes stop_codon:yes gene_type:complete
MIISRTPFRISLFGGGTDYPVWYNKYSGMVISGTINKYCFITARYLPPFFKYKHRIRYYKQEEKNSLDEIDHPSVRETAKFLDIKKGIEIVHNADLPAQSGLGSSSTFTVGLLNVLYGLKNYMPTKRELALNAIHIEQDLIGENVGSQDQTAAAFGGLNKIIFSKNNIVDVSPIPLSEDRMLQLENNLMLFFTGFARNASDIAAEQIKMTLNKKVELNNMLEICSEGINVLNNEKESIEKIGALLDEQWQIKRKMTHEISNKEIDDIYSTGISAGALGGKLLGAGGGGFILFYVPKKFQKKVQMALRPKLHVPFRFENTGSKIIYYSHQNNI